MTGGNTGVDVMVGPGREEGAAAAVDGARRAVGPDRAAAAGHRAAADNPGRRRPDDRKVLSGILFVLYTGIPGSSCRSSWASGPG